MSRQVRIVISCDGAPDEPCHNEVELDLPVTFSWAGKTFTRDLCVGHRDQFMDLMEIFASMSEEVKVKKAKPPADRAPRADRGVSRAKQPRVTCPAPDCGMELAKSSLDRHLRIRHPDYDPMIVKARTA